MTELNRAIKNLNLGRYYGTLYHDYKSAEYDEWIYLLKMNDKTYIGNLQVPRNPEDDDERDDKRVPNRYKYWFSGTSSQFKVLYVYEYTHNKNLCNQKVLNVIKKEIVDALHNNFNVQQLPDEYDIKDMFSKHITNWRRTITKSLKSYNINDCRNDMCNILHDISENINRWANALILRNRFSYISLEEDDIKMRDVIGFNNWSVQKQCLFIHMKDWLSMIVINSLNNKSSDNVEFYNYKLENNKFLNEKMFDDIRTNFFDILNVTKILLSLMYTSSTEYQIMTTYKKFIDWVNKTYLPYFNKNIINKR